MGREEVAIGKPLLENLHIMEYSHSGPMNCNTKMVQTKWAYSTLHCNLQGYGARSQENARNIEVVMDKTMVIVLRILLYFENDLEML
jgi:hypothetical protein